MSKCSKCGAVLGISAKFCMECGTQVLKNSEIFIGGDIEISNSTQLDDLYKRLVEDKSPKLDYDEFFKSSADVFDIVGISPFSKIDESVLKKIEVFKNDLLLKAEKLWSVNFEKQQEFNEALASLFSFFRYFESNHREVFEDSLFDKLNIVIDFQGENGQIDSQSYEKIISKAKNLGLWCDELPQRKEIVSKRINDYCKEKGYEISETSNQIKTPIIEKLGNELIFVEGNERIKSFYIGKYEVTQKLYESIMNTNPSSSIGDFKPVENVSWYEAVEFCNKLSEKSGLKPCYRINGRNTHCDKNANGFRIPTEEEWEYAAKGGKSNEDFEFPGSNNVDDVAWHKGNSDGTSHEVGTKKPNSLGLFDMGGNVWEWCWDSSIGGIRYYCGGSFGSNSFECSVSSDGCASAEEKSRVLGFRLTRNEN